MNELYYSSSRHSTNYTLYRVVKESKTRLTLKEVKEDGSLDDFRQIQATKHYGPSMKVVGREFYVTQAKPEQTEEYFRAINANEQAKRNEERSAAELRTLARQYKANQILETPYAEAIALPSEVVKMRMITFQPTEGLWVNWMFYSQPYESFMGKESIETRVLEVKCEKRGDKYNDQASINNSVYGESEYANLVVLAASWYTN